MVIQSIVLHDCKQFKAVVTTVTRHNGYWKTRSWRTVSCVMENRRIIRCIKSITEFIIISLWPTTRPGWLALKYTIWIGICNQIRSLWTVKKIVEKTKTKKILFSVYCRCIADLSLSHPAIPRKLLWKAIRFVNIPTAYSNGDDKVYE